MVEIPAMTASSLPSPDDSKVAPPPLPPVSSAAVPHSAYSSPARRSSAVESPEKSTTSDGILWATTVHSSSSPPVGDFTSAVRNNNNDVQHGDSHYQGVADAQMQGIMRHYQHLAPGQQLQQQQQSAAIESPQIEQSGGRPIKSTRPILPDEVARKIRIPHATSPVISPLPNLSDMALKLSADPGLEGWFSNVVDILQEHYSAERISVSVPGDATDLENVPWGQQAVFNESVCVNLEGHARPSDVDAIDDALKSPLSKRPSLFSRHSFAGFGSASRCDMPQPASDPRHTTNNSAHHWKRQGQFEEEGDRQIFPVPRPLEVESDPLIKRTGIVKLFGRTKPIVLTREYSQDTQVSSRGQGNDGGHVILEAQQSKTISVPRTLRSKSVSSIHAKVKQELQSSYVVPEESFEEYEQLAPSPWSQSPAPSPAARAHAEQNPFFTAHTVDKSAFSRKPPAHDYSRLESLEAIGVDRAKSIVHIPLLHRASKDQTLRFPIAILSFLSLTVPYPANLRESLAYLMPHLTSSFSLAQKYSQLERRVVSQAESSRTAQLLGLGGTFSSENSELELFAGLSGHVSNTLAEGGAAGDATTTAASTKFSSPGEKSSTTSTAKFSPALSAVFGGTSRSAAGVSNAGNPIASAGLFVSPSAATKHGNDAGDSYFNVKRSRSLRESAGVSWNGPRRNHVSSVPSSPGHGVGDPIDEVMLQDVDTVAGAGGSGDDGAGGGGGLPISPKSMESSPITALFPHQASQTRQTSTSSIYSQLYRELYQRPFTDTIAQLMLNSVPLHLLLAKPQTGEVIWTNTKFDAYRRSQSHQEQRSIYPWQNVHWSEQAPLSKKWQNALRTGSQFTERVRVKRFNDESSYRWFIFRANPLLSATGEVLYWIGSFLDVHEQHIAELKAVQERENFAINAKYRAFSNSIPQVVFEAAEFRGIIFANDQWQLYSGQPVEEAMNLGFAKHVHPDDLSKCNLFGPTPSADGKKTTTSSDEARETGQGVTAALSDLVKCGLFSRQKDENGRVFYSTEIRLRSKGGDYRWHLVRLVRAETISFGNGEASWYGTCTDINDRKLLEKELNKAMQQLNWEMESKTRFFSNMSHEIRTPLNGILGTIPFILDTVLDTDQRRMLDTIQNSSTNLRELVDNILDVSRVEAGKMSLVNSWFHVRSVIEDVFDTVASRASDKGLEINYLMDQEVPAMVIGDRFRIRQVLINLVGNAVKFTSRGEIYIACSILHDASSSLSIPLKPTQMLLNFDVVDTGKGFSAGDKERLMQRFSQLGANGSQQHTGSGLGLFLSKQLVEMHGGKITPSGEEGRGARFSFYVVVDVPPPPTATSSTSASTTTWQPPSWPLESSQQAVQAQPSHVIGQRELAPTDNDVPVSSNAAAAPGPFSILILAPFQHTGEAIKQHITHVVPHGIPFTIASLADVDDWKEAVNSDNNKDSPTYSHITHLVVNLPVDDVLDLLQYMAYYGGEKGGPSHNAPTLVIISDHYQKRKIQPQIAELTSRGIRIYMVPKPLKPSAFSPIFDPYNCRELSKDRNQDMARAMNDDFKIVVKMVKAVVGNKGHRILLVEDDDTNRQVQSFFFLSFLCPLALLTCLGFVEISRQDQGGIRDSVEWTRVYRDGSLKRTGVLFSYHRELDSMISPPWKHSS